VVLARLSAQHDGCVDNVCGAFDATELPSGACSLIVKDDWEGRFRPRLS